ncbi:hypothetical protein A3A76_00230 [Candidatus Woesebacteria bacterium RIFCSPLOWO2_01_FULL_39_23]|uniref:PIN domain-containing protein n=1 Tax=Candidatus Woesebacteria bacterium RIFCSPHIGHO2_01_FULL_40_22 TaxID=1802499 RepID=A0A1F7YHG3_9BACT|nr:MAG: hypothetical protein A2141_02910 [Candidatus Woesebacteria bacterium RBG_16_40_11]OGM26309.1 MAG: hypothetical protein A2628_03850 [Candidatus Woesebacteria bacterium RIFCSPHIGHO2_01_FULL_40_22]OGM38429.1 MAG: hypothetical protein A3E41_00180 [Candidatus Woesebacteria bacterium RIFCSPHIGHO2_12_FULL_38_9]OGM62864.1 MAG: hypothetical protein A3A76_00230 [Candidatus Woesebacteria bacterium RIFCSPLOWO2_01_FULL_39_23]
MILLDSNVLIYAINADSPKIQEAQKFINENKENLCVAHQNIFETLRVLTHPKFPNPMTSKSAIEAISAITDHLVNITPTFETKFVALELLKKYEIISDNIFDTYLASTMLTNDVSIIATDNEKYFSVFEEIKIINPFRKV